jgi:hypothetical protein
MKKIIFLFIATVFSICAVAQDAWHATIKVVDEGGQPIENADVQVWYYVPPPPDQNEASEKIEGLTDANGVFTASHSDTKSISLSFRVSKVGYYQTTSGQELGWQYDPVKWNPNKTLVLKKIHHPIPMYARAVDSEPPIFKKTGRPPITFNKSIGYDLTAGDWVAPYGKGQTTGIIFTEEFNKKSILDFYYKLTISFPNTGDGIQEFTVPNADKGSDLRSPHEAPADGYQPQLIREDFHHPGQTGKSDYDENRIYLFRTTLPDGLHYGKIYGDPIQMNFRYYLNPTPNDRNIEFDPKQNLLQGLKSFEQVTAP